MQVWVIGTGTDWYSQHVALRIFSMVVENWRLFTSFPCRDVRLVCISWCNYSNNSAKNPIPDAPDSG